MYTLAINFGGIVIQDFEPLIIGIDPGTRYCGVAVQRPNDKIFHGQIELARDFHTRRCSYEEFRAAVAYSTPGHVIQQEVARIGQHEEGVILGYSYVEQPTRRIVRREPKSKKTDWSPYLSNITGYWKRYLSELSPFLLVDMVDATKWQRIVLKDTYGNIHGSNVIESYALAHASVVLGHRIKSPHVADAICLVDFGRRRVLPELAAS